MDDEERAADPLAGGIMQEGHQCGMVWGSAMGAGAAALRRFDDRDRVIATTIKASAEIVDSFANRTGSVNCGDITDTDFSSKKSFARYMLTGKFVSCFKLADKWTPEAYESLLDSLSDEPPEYTVSPVSCASEVAKKMGATDRETVMVSGLAGGIGLKGDGCGALGAAIWMKTLAWCRENPKKNAFRRKIVIDTLKAFNEATAYEYVCREITGRDFSSIDEHTDFIRGGGCAELIDALARA